MRADCSDITVRSWCCTATADSAPNSRSSSLARWPFSGPKTSSTCLPSTSATARAFSVNAPSTSRETFSNSVRTKSALTSACSRDSTRAPISIASTSTSAASAPASDALAHQLDGDAVAHGERVGDDDVAEHGDARGAEGRGGFHGDQSPYARRPTERMRAAAGAQPTPKPVRPSGSSSATSSRSTSAWPGPSRQTATSRSTASASPSKHRLDRAVAAVGRPARHARALGRAPHRVAEEDALHPPVGAHPLAHGHVGTVDRWPRSRRWTPTSPRSRSTRSRTPRTPSCATAAASRPRSPAPAAPPSTRSRAPPRRSASARRSRRPPGDDAVALGHPRRDDGARRADVGRHHPPLDRLDAARARTRSAPAASRSWRSAPASAASRSTRPRGSRSRRSARHLAAGSQLERIVFAVHGERARAAFQAAIDAAG